MSPTDHNAPTPSNANGSKVISNKAWRIRKLGDEVEDAGKNHIDPAKTQLDAIGVGYPGFSIVGIPLAMAHTVLGNQASRQLDRAVIQLGDWKGALNKTATTWEAAEEASKVATK